MRMHNWTMRHMRTGRAMPKDLSRTIVRTVASAYMGQVTHGMLNEVLRLAVHTLFMNVQMHVSAYEYEKDSRLNVYMYETGTAAVTHLI